MTFELIDSISLPGDADKPNEDAFGCGPLSAVVIDGATNLGPALMPGGNDAAWLSRFGARRLMAHAHEGKSPRKALRDALADAEKSFHALRRGAPEAMWQMPSASMMYATQKDGGIEFLWYGDCAALVLRPGEDVLVVGTVFENRAAESGRAAMAREKNLEPVLDRNRPEILDGLRAARNRNNGDDHWRFSPDASAASHVSRRIVEAPSGTQLLLASDGFTALATGYGVYDAAGLMAAAMMGLFALGDEVRVIENNDPLGRQFPRFKKSDDATALLLVLT